MRDSKRDTNPGGRPRKYASAAEKQRAYRERWATLSGRVEQRTKDTVETIRLATGADVTIGDVLNAAIKFYAVNFDWQSGNLFGKRLPTINDPRYRAQREREQAAQQFIEGADDGIED